MRPVALKGRNYLMKPRSDIYQTVTDQLVAAIEAGAAAWRFVASVFSQGDSVCAGRA